MRKLLLFILFFSPFALAETAFDRTYNVQILVFSHITLQSLQAEQWPFLSQTVLDSFNQSLSSDQTVKPARLLQREKKILERNPDYRILFSGSFTRTWHGDTDTVSFPISNGSNLKGNMSIMLDHYFNVHTDLLLTEPTAFLEKLDTNNYFKNWNHDTFSFQFSQDRRMRSNELNYLGYPLMGVLIKIIKV